MTVPPGTGLTVVGGVVVLTGPIIRTTLDAVLIAARSRRLSGMPTSTTYRALAEALLAASAAGQSDVPTTTVTPCSPVEPDVTIREAATMLGISYRQTRRLAPRLGGRITGGRWMLDRAAINEHLQGKDTWTDEN
jgi:hypothetical protein